MLWGQDKRVLIFPMICIVGGFGVCTLSLLHIPRSQRYKRLTRLCIVPAVSGLAMVVAMSKSPLGQAVFSHGISVWFSTFGVLSCAANIYAVILMSWKAWSEAFSLL